jgi:hypothetical protein
MPAYSLTPVLPLSDGRLRRLSGFAIPRTTASNGWARGVDGAIDSVEQLLNDGQVATVIELCESALQSLLAPSRRWMIPMATSACCEIGCRTSITGREEARPIRWNWPGASSVELHSDFDVHSAVDERENP